MQQTLVLLKPDAVARRLIGRILARFEDRGLRLAGLRLLQIDESTARKLYHEHEGKDFYEPLVSFITSGPVVAVVLRGREAIPVVRAMMGPTFGPDAPPGTIRGDFGLSRRFNIVHGSDSAEAAEREIALFFEQADLVDDPAHTDFWLYARSERESF